MSPRACSRGEGIWLLLPVFIENLLFAQYHTGHIKDIMEKNELLTAGCMASKAGLSLVKDTWDLAKARVFST